MSEKETVLNDKETQDTQLELDIATFSFAPSTPANTEEAPAEKPMTKKQARKAKKAEKKANEPKKCDKKKEKKCKKCKKCVFFAWFTLLIAVACAVAPIATLVTPGYKPLASSSLLNGFFGAAHHVGGMLNLELFATAPTILTAGKLGLIYTYGLLALPVVILLTLVLALVTCASKKPCAVAKATAIINFLYFFCLCGLFVGINYLKNKQVAIDLASLIATAITFFLVVFSASASKKKAKKKAAKEEAVVEVVEEVVSNEENADDSQSVDVIEGVCGVVETEEETEEQSPFGLNFGSSYMKNKQALMGFEPVKAKNEPTETAVSYDWFLESLTADERREFVSLFIYKSLPGTATLPDYVSGGDNYMFFRRFFLNLGKYRDSVSANLLEKIYQYMTHLY